MKNTLLQFGQYYHIFNRGNNRENLFLQERNYHYFMKLYDHHIYPIAETYAYCLLRNHFHFLIRIRDQPLPKKPAQAFSNLFNAYTRAFNNMFQRTGALFERPYRRILIQNQKHFRNLAIYIHQNPQNHGFTEDFRDWPFSSYQSIISDRPTKLMRNQVLNWFDDPIGYREWHNAAINHPEIRGIISDDID